MGSPPPQQTAEQHSRARTTRLSATPPRAAARTRRLERHRGKPDACSALPSVRLNISHPPGPDTLGALPTPSARRPMSMRARARPVTSPPRRAMWCSVTVCTHLALSESFVSPLSLCSAAPAPRGTEPRLAYGTCSGRPSPHRTTRPRYSRRLTAAAVAARNHSSTIAASRRPPNSVAHGHATAAAPPPPVARHRARHARH